MQKMIDSKYNPKDIVQMSEVKSTLDSIKDILSLKAFFLEYFDTFEQERYRDFFLTLEDTNSTENLELIKGILYFSLIYGFPSIDYIFYAYQHEQSRMQNRLDPKALFNRFLKCIYFHMAEKALRITLYRRFLLEKYPDVFEMLGDSTLKSEDLPLLGEFADLNELQSNIDSAVTNTLMERATNLSSFLCTEEAQFQKQSRRQYGMKLVNTLLSESELESVRRIVETKRTMGDVSPKINFNFYYTNNLTFEL